MPTIRRIRSSLLLRSAAPAFLLLATTGCAEEVATVFDEDGVWAVVAYDLDNSGLVDVFTSREGGFMLKFHQKKGVVEAASCQDDSGNQTVTSSGCHSDPNSVFACRCFAYEFVENIMRWVEYEAGSAPPSVPGVIVNDSEGAMEGHTQILVGESATVMATKSLAPLPRGLFGGTDESTFVIQQKAPVLWDDPPNKPPEMPPACGCV